MQLHRMATIVIVAVCMRAEVSSSAEVSCVPENRRGGVPRLSICDAMHCQSSVRRLHNTTMLFCYQSMTCQLQTEKGQQYSPAKPDLDVCGECTSAMTAVVGEQW